MKTIKKTNVEQEVLNYLNKTAKHLFITDSGDFYKILNYKDKEDGKLKIAIFSFSGVNVQITTLGLEYYINEYGGNAKNVIKNMIFTDYTNVTSIPNFKLMKEKMAEVQKKLESGEHDDVPKILNGLEPKK